MDDHDVATDADAAAAAADTDSDTDASSAQQGSNDLLGARLCARVGCGGVAEHTLTADYNERVMAVGPLSPIRMPPALDLCARHSEALRPPEGWTLLRHDPRRE